MIELKRSDVIFLEDVHQYWLGNTKLSGYNIRAWQVSIF